MSPRTSGAKTRRRPAHPRIMSVLINSSPREACRKPTDFDLRFHSHQSISLAAQPGERKIPIAAISPLIRIGALLSPERSNRRAPHADCDHHW